MDDVLPMVNNMKAHIARVEAELAQARETIVLMSEAALSQQQEIARLRLSLELIAGCSKCPACQSHARAELGISHDA